MSGTSLDGLDLALCAIQGNGLSTKLEIKKFISIAYEDDYKEIVKPLFANPHADLASVCTANAWVARKHAQMIKQSLTQWGLEASDIDLIASHGQTIFHAPAHMHNNGMPNATLQIGDGDHIAHLTEIITVSDFRQKHVVAGGEGAPMVKYGDYLLFTDKHEYRALVNLGGIANVSIIPPNAAFSDIVSTDTGTANTFLDAMVQRFISGQNFDHNGDIAASGTIHQGLLAALLEHPFLRLSAPKTTGQEAFSMDWLQTQIRLSGAEQLPLPDLLASLAEFSVISLCDVVKQLVPKGQLIAVYVSGGGANNQYLLSRMQVHLAHASISPMQALGVSADAKEAALFALLANECITGCASTFANSSGTPNVSMGKISLPN